MPRKRKDAEGRGGAHGNRTDLTAKQPVRTATGQQYGEAGRQEQAQRQVPLPQQASPMARTAPGAVPWNLSAAERTAGRTAGRSADEINARHAAAIAAGQAFDFNPVGLAAPSGRPDEPITAGLPIGAGPGPEALGMAPTPLDELRAIYQRFPTEELRELIEEAERGG